jgi:hypothetical protein
MEMRDDIVSILKGAIGARVGEHYAGHTADRKQEYETNGPQQWRTDRFWHG